MIARDQLDSAVTAGILSASQADRLAHHLDPNGAAHDPEEVRFSRGFHDVFIAIGIAILLIGTWFALSAVLPDGSATVIVAPVVAALIWGLSEIFIVRKKLALPAIVLALGFAPLAVISTFGFLGTTAGEVLSPVAGDEPGMPVLIIALIAGLIVTFVYQLRFKVPITYAAIAAMAIGLLLSLVELAKPGLVEEQMPWLLLLAGFATFSVAMWFDMRDVHRVSLNTDKAFWLHLLAAPMIVHSVLATVVGTATQESDAVMVIAIVAALAIVALIVDRRALLVSGLAYLGFAIGMLLREASVDETVLVAGTMVIVGLIILMLGSGWSALRAMLMRPLSGTTLATYLPPARI